MKIKADYVNAPQWRELTVKSRLPEQLKCLDELAHNLWWAWNNEAPKLFKSLDADLYCEGQGAHETREGCLHEVS